MVFLQALAGFFFFFYLFIFLLLKTLSIGESARNHRRYVRGVSVNAFDGILQHCRDVYQIINLVKAEHIYLLIDFRTE